MSNQAKWLHRFLHALASLEYPSTNLAYAFIEGNSTDDSLQLLGEWLAGQKKKGIPFHLRKVDVDRQLDPCSRLAFLRNELLKLVVDADCVLMIDSDVVEIPPHLLKRLLSWRKDIIAPLILIEGTGEFYDTLAFRIGSNRFAPHVQIHGPDPIPVDSVGTCYLMTNRVAQRVRYGQGESEQVAFCEEAHAKGFQVFVDPTISVEHVNLHAYGIPWH